MGSQTGIEWADHTFNPWMGCTKVSPACDHCYAEALMDTRWGKVKWGAGKPRVRTAPANWRQPLAWNAAAKKAGIRRRVFCASLADVFDTEVPDAWRIDLMKLIEQTPDLDWLLLTKRPNMALKWFTKDWPAMPPNLWIGTTVENQEMADLRIPLLLQIPARVRFLSCEPLLGPVDLTHIQAPRFVPEDHEIDWKFDALATGSQYDFKSGEYWDSGDGPGREHQIDWVIAGGESGQGAQEPRAAHPDWFRSLRDQCAAAGVAYFFKQWGDYGPAEPFEADTNARTAYRGEIQTLVQKGKPDIKLCIPTRDDDTLGKPLTLHKIGKRLAGALLDGREHKAFPKVAA